MGDDRISDWNNQRYFAKLKEWRLRTPRNCHCEGVPSSLTLIRTGSGDRGNLIALRSRLLRFTRNDTRRINRVTLTLTQKAAERLQRIRWRQKAEGCLRVKAEKHGGAQWVFQMGFDVEREGDEKTESQGVIVVMDKQTAKVLNGVTVDFEGTGGKGTFTFRRTSAA